MQIDLDIPIMKIIVYKVVGSFAKNAKKVSTTERRRFFRIMWLTLDYYVLTAKKV